MTFFSDDFTRADEALLALTDWDAFQVELRDHYIRTDNFIGGFALRKEVMSHPDQHIRIHVAAQVVGDAFNYVDMLFRLDDSVVAATAVTSTLSLKGYIGRIHWDVSSADKIQIYKWDGVVGNTKLLLKDSGSIGFQSEGGSSIQVVQDFRGIIDDVPGGIRIRLYLNQLNDESPTLEFIDRGRDTGPTAGALVLHEEAGRCGLFLDTGTGTDGPLVYDFLAEDRATVEPIRWGSEITAKNYIDQLLVKLDRSSSSGIDRSVVLQWIEDGLKALYADLGWNSFFWRRNDIMALSADPSGASRRAICHKRIRMIQEIRKVETARPLVHFEYIGHDSGGHLIIHFGNEESGPTSEYEYTYYVRPELPLLETTVIDVPREFMLAVIKLAMIEAVESDADVQFEGSIRLDARDWVARCHKEANRLLMMSRNRETLRGHSTSRAGSRIIPIDQLYGGWPR